MSLNVKDKCIHGLVRRVATRTGLSQTRVVERAAAELLTSLEAETVASGLDQLLNRMHAKLTVFGGALNFDALYDLGTGLSR